MKIDNASLEAKFAELEYTPNLDEEIDKAVEGVYDELKVLIEQMTCNSRMHSNYLCYEARFAEALTNLRWLCFENMRRYDVENRRNHLNATEV